MAAFANVSLSPVPETENSDISRTYGKYGPKESSPIHCSSVRGQLMEMETSENACLNETSIRSLFDNCDRGGRGFITAEDFHLHCGLSPELAEQVLSQLDVDEDGISFDEFFHGFQSIAKRLQDKEEGPVNVSKPERELRTKLLRDESVFESNPLLDDDRWMEVVIRIGLPENIANSLCMKNFWNKLYNEAPALVPSLEAVLSDVSVQLKCADENLQTLNHHLHNTFGKLVNSYHANAHRKEAQHFEEVASFQEEIEEQLSEIIQEYTLKGSFARRKLEGNFVEAVNERDKEIEDLLLQIRLLKEELEHRQELIPQGQPAVHKTTVNGAILPEQVHTASINPTSRPTSVPNVQECCTEDNSSQSTLSLNEEKDEAAEADTQEAPLQPLLTPEITDSPRCVVSATPSRVFKVVFLGDSGVGKTSLIRKMCNDDLSKVEPTIGVDFMTTVVKTCKETVALQLWDTAGQERFAPLSSVYLRRADAIALVYDVTSLESFRSISKWFDTVKAVQSKGKVVIAVVGAKSDLRHAVSAQCADQAATGPHFYASSYSGENVTDILLSLTRLLLQQEDECMDDTKLKLQCERFTDSKCSC